MYAVRPATPEDLAEVLQVDAAIIGDTHDEGVMAPAIAAGRVIVAVEDGEVIGYLRWEPFWDTIPLCLTVRVRPEHQRRGVGRALYDVAEDRFRSAGRQFWLSSTEESNERSILFHMALGFRPVGMLHDLGQDVGEIFFRKDLV